ncbi:MAG: 16S rRNA (guanine(966)-N(2))-methyltransferase RsmD [Acetobacteraceae bacterium]
MVAPPGETTRPTADRVRQALFDRLLHAPWAGRAAIDGALVLDAFAGTGALGLEALSRGAAASVFLERDRAALQALRANIAACRAEARCTVLGADVLRPPPGRVCDMVFLDPPYGQAIVPAAVAALAAAGWIAAGSLVLAELGRADPVPDHELLDEFAHGAARMVAFRPG